MDKCFAVFSLVIDTQSKSKNLLSKVKCIRRTGESC